MKVVLVHGIFNTGAMMSWMKYRLKKHGHDCFAPSVKPFDGRGGIQRAAKNLQDQIEARFGESEPIAIVGFSMGAIVARYYLQAFGGASRCSHLITLAAPHNGSYWAYLPYPTLGMRQLRPNSAFLKSLQSSEQTLDNIQLYSFWSPLDTSIVPSTSSRWDRAINQKFYIPLHGFTPFHGPLIKAIANCLSND